MKCYVVQDLLPLYAEQLVAEETAADIKAHLESCADCTEFYAQMESPAPKVVVPEDIKPLKKVKRRSRTEIIVGSLCCAVVLTLFVLFGVYGVIPLDSSRLQMKLRVYWLSSDENGERQWYDTAEEAGDHAEERIDIEFKGDCIEWRNTLSGAAWWHHRGESDEDIISSTLLTFYPTVIPMEFHRRYWAVMHLDEPVEDGSLIVIHCRDRELVFEVTELANRARNGETVINCG